MNWTHQTARKALRRKALNRFLAATGVGLSAAGVVAIVAVVVDRLLALNLNNWLLVGTPLALGLIGAAVVALLTPRNLLRAAAEVDQALALQDRLSTGIALRDHRDDPFAAIAIEDAETTAREVRVSRAAPIRFGSSWWLWPIALTAAVACAIFLPVFDLVNREAEAAQRASAVAEQMRAAAQLADARRAVTPDDVQTEDLATPSELAILDELEKQLTSGSVDPDEARAKAAGALSESARQLERTAEAQEQQVDALREELKNLDRGEGAEASPLSKALSRGDFEEAQRLIEQYHEALDQLEAQEREALADELRRAAESINQDSSESAAPTPTHSEESLRDLGVDEQTIDDLKQETDPDSIRDRLREEGVDEPVAERLAEEMARENRRREAQEQAREDAQRLKEALEESAREVSEPNPEPPSSEPGAPDPAQPRPQESPNERPTGDQQPQSQPGQEQRTGDEPARREESPNSQPQPGREQEQTGGEGGPQRDPQRESPEQSPSEGEESPGGEPSKQQSPGGPEQPQKSPDGAPSESQPGEPGSPGQQQSPNGSPDGERAPDPSTTPGQPGEQKQPGDAPGTAPSPDGMNPEGMGDGMIPEPDEKGLERARRLMEEFRNRQRGAQEQRESAQRARERAQKLLEEMSPQQREQLDRWARELSRERGQSAPPAPPAQGEFANETLDLRPREESPDRVIAQWFNPDSPADRAGGVSRRVVDEQLQEAAQGAERAVEEQSVHRRYNDIIKRYFDAARNKNPQ